MVREREERKKQKEEEEKVSIMSWFGCALESFTKVLIRGEKDPLAYALITTNYEAIFSYNICEWAMLAP